MQLPENLPSRYSRMTSGPEGPVSAHELMRDKPHHVQSSIYKEADIDPKKLLRPGVIGWKDTNQRRRPFFNIEDAGRIIAAAESVSKKNILKSIEGKHAMTVPGGRHHPEIVGHKTDVAVDAASKAAIAASAAKKAADVAKTNTDHAVAEQAAETAVHAAAKAQESAAAAVAVAKEAVADASDKKAKASAALGAWEQEYPGLHAWESDVQLDGWLGDAPAKSTPAPAPAPAAEGGMKKILCCMACVAVGAGIGIFLAKKAII